MVSLDNSSGPGTWRTAYWGSESSMMEVWEPLASSALLDWLMASGSQICAWSLYLQDNSKRIKRRWGVRSHWALSSQRREFCHGALFLSNSRFIEHLPLKQALSFHFFMKWIPSAVFGGWLLLVFAQEERSTKIARDSKHFDSKAQKLVCFLLTPILLIIVMTVMTLMNFDHLSWLAIILTRYIFITVAKMQALTVHWMLYEQFTRIIPFNQKTLRRRRY